MENFSDEQMNKLVDDLADQLIKRIYGVQNPEELTKPYEGEDMVWYADRDDDHVVGQYVTDPSSGMFTNVFSIEPRTYGIALGYNFN